jgi:hypothetical protein
MKEKEGKKHSDEETAQLMEEAMTVFRERHLPALARGMMKGVFKLDDESKRIVLKEVAAACGQFTRDYWHREREGLEFPKGTMDIDSAFEFLDNIAPHRRTYERTGDTVYFKTHMKESYGKCLCPLVVLGIIDPDQGSCLCGGYFFNDSMEYLTGKSWDDPEVLQTLRMGDSESCDFIFKCKDCGDCSK